VDGGWASLEGGRKAGMNGGKSGERGIGREVRGRKARGNRKTKMDRSIRGGQAESEGEDGRGEIRGAPMGADVLCTPVKWPMQIERQRWTVGVHVSVNEPISTSFLLFDSFSEECTVHPGEWKRILNFGLSHPRIVSSCYSHNSFLHNEDKLKGDRKMQQIQFWIVSLCIHLSSSHGPCPLITFVTIINGQRALCGPIPHIDPGTARNRHAMRQNRPRFSARLRSLTFDIVSVNRRYQGCVFFCSRVRVALLSHLRRFAPSPSCTLSFLPCSLSLSVSLSLSLSLFFSFASSRAELWAKRQGGGVG